MTNESVRNAAIAKFLENDGESKPFELTEPFLSPCEEVQGLRDYYLEQVEFLKGSIVWNKKLKQTSQNAKMKQTIECYENFMENLDVLHMRILRGLGTCPDLFVKEPRDAS